MTELDSYNWLRKTGVPPKYAFRIAEGINPEAVIITINQFERQDKTIGELISFLDWANWKVIFPKSLGR